MSINLSGTIRYNSDTGNIELEENNAIVPISEDWYVTNVYNCQPSDSSHVPITAAPTHGIRIAYQLVYVGMSERVIGTLKMEQFINLVNKFAEVVGGV